MKKFLSILLSMILSIAYVSIPISASEEIETTQSEIKNSIINQSKEISGLSGDFNIVSTTSTLSTRSTNSINSNANELVLQSNVQQDDENCIHTAIIPYKILENGKLINSFEYANTIAPRATNQNPVQFVDVTVTVLTHYALYQCYDFYWVYRHSGIEAYWSSSNSSATVSKMLVRYESCGDLYAYPDVVNNGITNSTRLQKDYFISSEINQSNPIKGTTYRDANHTMPTNRVIYCCDYMLHGGLIYLQCSYKVNGTSYTHDVSYYVYSK